MGTCERRHWFGTGGRDLGTGETDGDGYMQEETRHVIVMRRIRTGDGNGTAE